MLIQLPEDATCMKTLALGPQKQQRSNKCVNSVTRIQASQQTQSASITCVAKQDTVSKN